MNCKSLRTCLPSISVANFTLESLIGDLSGNGSSQLLLLVLFSDDSGTNADEADEVDCPLRLLSSIKHKGQLSRRAFHSPDRPLRLSWTKGWEEHRPSLSTSHVMVDGLLRIGSVAADGCGWCSWLTWVFLLKVMVRTNDCKLPWTCDCVVLVESLTVFLTGRLSKSLSRAFAELSLLRASLKVPN